MRTSFGIMGSNPIASKKIDSKGKRIWDMVTIYSRKDCPNCFDDELRYIFIKYLDESKRLLLECDTCGWTENIDGSKYEGQIGKVYPAGKKELKRYLTKWIN